MWIKTLLLFFVFSFLFKTDFSFDQDLGRHLKLGGIIWQAKAVPGTNLFSYTNPDFPFINTHWLFEVWVYLARHTFGLEILLVIKISIFLLAVWLVLKTIPKEQSVLLLPIGFIFLHVLRERTELRPEIFSFLFTASTVYILDKYLKTPTKLICLLPAISLIWVNTHIYFFVGLILQAVFILHTRGKLKTLILVFILSVLLSLINPRGLTGLIYPVNVTNNYGYTIVENQTMFLLESIGFKDPNFLFVKLAIAIIILSLAVALARRKLALKNLLLAVTGGALALLNVRSFPYLVFISLPAVLANFGPIRKPRLITSVVITALGLSVLAESYCYLNGQYYLYQNESTQPGLRFEESGRKALDFVVKNQLPGPVYNNFDIGSYIIYRGYPRYRVFVDGRPESYPQQFFSQTYIPSQADYVKFKQLDSRYNFQTVIFSHTDQTPWGKTFLSTIVPDKDWATVYLDDFMIVLIKNTTLIANKQLSALAPIDLAKLDPASYTFNHHVPYLRLSLFLAQTGNLASAQKFAEKGLAIFPASPLGNALFGIKSQDKFFW